MTRPWQSAVPHLPETVKETVQFPTDEEADGLVRIAWRGPSALVRMSHDIPDMCMHVTWPGMQFRVHVT